MCVARDYELKDNALIVKTSRLKKWFHDRGYPENTIDNQLKRVKNVGREELLKPKESGNKIIGIPFNVTYHRHLTYLGKLI